MCVAFGKWHTVLKMLKVLARETAHVTNRYLKGPDYSLYVETKVILFQRRQGKNGFVPCAGLLFIAGKTQ